MRSIFSPCKDPSRYKFSEFGHQFRLIFRDFVEGFTWDGAPLAPPAGVRSLRARVRAPAGVRSLVARVRAPRRG